MSSYTVVSAPVEDEAVVKQVLARMDTMQALTDEWMKPDGWHKDGEKHGCDTFSRSGKKGEPNIFKISTRVDFTPVEIMGMYRDSDVLKKWDKHVGGHQLVRKLDENTNIIYAYSPGVPLISPRDFIYVARWNVTDTKITQFTYSFDTAIADKCAPHRKGYVRGAIVTDIMVLEASDDGKYTTMTSFNQTDVKGWIPTSVVSAAAGNALAETISLLKKYMAENKK